jgi:hypothetical protein
MLTWYCYVFNFLFLYMQSYRWFALFNTFTYHKLVKQVLNLSADGRISFLCMADRAALLQWIYFRLTKWFTVLSLSRSPWYWLSGVVAVHTTAGSMHMECVQQMCVCVCVCVCACVRACVRICWRKLHMLLNAFQPVPSVYLSSHQRLSFLLIQNILTLSCWN